MASLPVRLIARVVLSSGIGYLVSAAAVIDLNFVDLPEIVKVTTVVLHNYSQQDLRTRLLTSQISRIKPTWRWLIQSDLSPSQRAEKTRA